ncbi:MAG: TonB-dependent receptor family protein [Bacteroidales bacterium]|nr:TonB-dependent receptor family protein [Bacteroidales bacterium]
MKKLIILFPFFWNGLILAQRDDHTSFSWTLKGVVLDSLSKKPIEYCMVSVFLLKDSSLVTGGITNENGQFNITVPRPGKFRITFSFLGYTPKTVSPVQISPQTSLPNASIDMGTIYLMSSTYRLKEVTIEDDRPQIELELDKKVIHVKEDITSQGGTALDLLRNVPGIEVDQDGNISLRGSENVLVLIDGRPSTLTGSNRRAALEQIQGSNIERIEILTNPSTKYNPEGMTGIINLILKKKKGSGFNSILTMGIGSKNKYNGNFALNYSTDKYSVFLNLDGSNRQSFQMGKRERFSYYLLDQYYLFQKSNGSDLMQNYSVKFGGDWYFLPGWTLSASVTTFFNEGIGKDKTNSFYEDPSGDTTLSFITMNNYTRGGHNTDLAINMMKRFKQPQEELTIDFSWSNSKFIDTSFNRFLFFKGDSIESQLTNWQLYQRATKHQIGNGKINWSYPLSDSMLMEAGFEGSLRLMNFRNENLWYDFNQLQWKQNDTLLYTYIFKEQIAALYGVLKKQWKRWSASGGIRLEHAQTNVHLIDSADNINVYKSIFLSGAISHMIRPNHQIQLTYSRRINRPSFFNLNPFKDYSNYPNIRAGNPYLKPEYIHSVEFSYALYGKKFNFIPSVFYKYVTDVITRYRQSINDSVFIMTWQNYQSAVSTGIDATFSGKPQKWWNFTISGQYYWTRINGQNIETSITGDARGWSLKTNQTFKLPHMTELQFTGMFNGPRFTGQGTRQPSWAVNAGFRKSFLKDKIIVSLNAMDIFMTQKFEIIFDQPTYFFINQHKHESPIVMLNLTWKLKGDYKPRDRKKRDRENQNYEDMDF